MSELKRRDFLKVSAGIAAGTAVGAGPALFAPDAERSHLFDAASGKSLLTQP